MYKSLVVLLGLFCFAAARVCLPNECDTVRCDMTPMESCEGRLDMNGGYCGCCPACIKQLQEGDSCMNLFIHGVPKTSECSQGTVCHPESKTCKKVMNPCHAEVAAKKEMLNNAEGPIMGMHMPTCTEEGFYAPKQCVENTCQCVKADGTPIEGYQTTAVEGKKMECQCARDKVEQEAEMMMGGYKRTCDPLGNYDKRQCHETSCWCSDRKGNSLGYEAHVSQASQMTCECARSNSERNLGQFKCDELGNYFTIPPASN